MKPLTHAQISAYRYGGTWQDYFPLHDLFDISKSAFPSVQHRAYLHSDYGCELVRRSFPPYLVASDGTTVSTRQLCIDHNIEDVGRVVPLEEWADLINLAALSNFRRPINERFGEIHDNPPEGLARKWGGSASDYAELVAFFDVPIARAGNAGEWLYHNSFGIWLCERIIGPVIDTGKKIVSTRGAAEDLVLSRLGFIPTAATVLSRMRMKQWMRGVDVPEALRKRGNELGGYE